MINIEQPKNMVGTPHIVVRDAEKAFPRQGADPLRVLAGINLEVQPGEFVAVLGPSGCGKSTLLNVLAGQEVLDAGSVEFHHGPRQSHRRRIAAVWQEEASMPWKSALGNVEFPLLLAGRPQFERHERALNWLTIVGLAGFERSYPSQLSAGMRKRVSLAAALVTHPEVLLMDEPFSALDVYTKQQVEKEVVKVWETLDATIVMVTHDVQEAVALADRVVVLTERPARVKLERQIDLPRPRDLDALFGDKAFHEIVRELWLALTNKQ
jgi:NitT/TauT family transport system ATP-binding protein